ALDDRCDSGSDDRMGSVSRPLSVGLHIESSVRSACDVGTSDGCCGRKSLRARPERDTYSGSWLDRRGYRPDRNGIPPLLRGRRKTGWLSLAASSADVSRAAAGATFPGGARCAHYFRREISKWRQQRFRTSSPG